jgi:hypothetical protein
VVVESADQHDANALLPTLEQLAQKGMLPEEMLADSLYGSDSNCEAALQEHQVTVIAPVIGEIDCQTIDRTHFFAYSVWEALFKGVEMSLLTNSIS